MERTQGRTVRVAALACILAGAAGAGADDLLVSAYTSNSVAAYCGETGEFIETLPNDAGLLGGAQAIDIGPDGLLYVCSETENRVLRYTPTLELVDSFIWDDPNTLADETGGLLNPTGGLFGPDGHFYVSSFETDAILKYDGNTGVFLEVFVPPGRGGLNGPDAGMVFHPNGDLLVPSFWTNAIPRYDSTGAYLGDFVPPGVGLAQPRVILIREDVGDVLVNSSLNDSVRRFALEGGTPLGTFANLDRPSGLERDADGNIYVARIAANVVRKFGPDGTRLGAFVTVGSGGIVAPTFLKFIPARRCEGDTDADGDVDMTDLASLLSLFDACTANLPAARLADANRDGCVDLTDLAILLHWFAM